MVMDAERKYVQELCDETEKGGEREGEGNGDPPHVSK